MDFSIIVAAWPPKQSERLNIRTFLDSLAIGFSTDTALNHAEFVIVQNGFDSALEEFLRSHALHPHVIVLPNNLGVAPAWNIGAANASSDVLVIANEDILVSIQDLARLASAAQQSGTGIAGVSNSVWSRLSLRESTSSMPGPHESRVAAGRLFSIRSEVWNQVDGVDDSLAPAFFEEVDLGFKIDDIGLEVVEVDRLVFEHAVGVSSGRARRHTISWGSRCQTVASIHRTNHRYMLKKWSSQNWRSLWLPHLVTYYFDIALIRSRNLATKLMRRRG
jgi:GT2 family glycosyltransferase